MGEFLTSPVNDKDKKDGGDEFLRYGICSMQAWEKRMENTYINDSKGNFYVFGIFDGHGGAEVAQYLKNHFCKELFSNQNFSSSSMKTALQETFHKMDELMLKEEGKKELRQLRAENKKKEKAIYEEIDSKDKEIEILKKMLEEKEEEEEGVADLCGATACVGVVDKKKKKFTFAIIGNSVVVYSKKDGRNLHEEAKNKPADEADRITKAGGWVIDNLVKGNLNTTRSFGDFDYKKNKNPNKKNIILVEPTIFEHEIDDSEDYLLMVTEGVYDCIQDEDICKIINQFRTERGIDLKSGKISEVLEKMFNDIVAEDIYNNLGKAYNNMTCILIKINGK